MEVNSLSNLGNNALFSNFVLKGVEKGEIIIQTTKRGFKR